MSKKYYTADFKTLTKIEEFDTEEQARATIDLYERRDRAIGRYVPKNYVVLKGDYSSNLKRIRKKTGLSQSQLAEASGVNVRMIQYYEQGFKDINNASALTVYRLAEALSTTVGELLEIEK